MSAPDAGRVIQPHRLLSLPERLLERKRSSGRLGSLLAWAVVFADIGTSIYYVPGILYGEAGTASARRRPRSCWRPAWPFILLALKYVEVSARYPDGGGVVSVATDAFGPMVGCLGGS